MIQAIGLSTIDKKLDGMKMTQKQTYSYSLYSKMKTAW